MDLMRHDIVLTLRYQCGDAVQGEMDALLLTQDLRNAVQRRQS